MRLTTRVLFSISFLIILSTTALAADQPNILFIMADDHTSQAIGVYGGRLAPLNPTPTIDALAAEGMVLENAFCQNSICTPSRASIMTGQGSATNGCETLGRRLPKQRQYLALEMKKAGYETAIVGKWHLKERPAAFDYYKVLPGQGKYFDPVFFETGATDEHQTTLGQQQQLLRGTVQMQGHSSDCITDSALHWLRDMRDREKPFFLKLHFKAPHGGFDYAPRYESYLADTAIPEPANLWKIGNHGSLATRGHHDELRSKIGSSVSSRHEARNYSTQLHKQHPTLSKGEITRRAYQNYLKKYLRCVKGVDDNVKRVVDYLKAENLLDNTLILYTGDQGFYLGEHDYIDKRWPYEESMRMPLIVRFPQGVTQGRSDAIVENIDFAPTMLDFAGVSTPEYMQGVSFRKILQTGQEPDHWKQSAYYHYWMHMASHFNPACVALRTKRYKLILYYGTAINSDQPDTPPAWEFYDLQTDPTEDNNLIGDPQYTQTIADLKRQLKHRRGQLGELDAKYKFNKVIDHYWDYGPEQKDQAIRISQEFAKQKLQPRKKRKSSKKLKTPA